MHISIVIRYIIMNNIKEYIQRYIVYINLILLAIGFIGLIVFGVEVYRNSQIEAIESVTEEDIYSQNSQELEKQYIDIQGQIVKPGVYEITRGETFQNILVRSGGFTEKADLRYVQLCLNQAKKLVDEQKIYIPAIVEDYVCGEDPTSNSYISNSKNDRNLISLNNASLEELMTLDGIGESTANKIIDARPYSSLEELLEVKGIGQSTYEKIQDNIKL